MSSWRSTGTSASRCSSCASRPGSRATATYEIHIVRPAHGAEDWFDVSGRSPGDGATQSGARRGLAIANDAKYGYDVPDRRWRCFDCAPRALRSDPDGPYPFQDQGRQHLHAPAAQRRLAHRDRRPSSISGRSRCSRRSMTGRCPRAPRASRSSRRASSPQGSEDTDDLVVRAYEAHGRETRATLRFPAWDRTRRFGPFEIKTFRVPGDPDAASRSPGRAGLTGTWDSAAR